MEMDIYWQLSQELAVSIVYYTMSCHVLSPDFLLLLIFCVLTDQRDEHAVQPLHHVPRRR